MSCSSCGKDLTDHKITVEKNGASSLYCSPICFNQDTENNTFKHRYLSEIVLNKTLFEVLALITGLGGVYYTIYDSISGFHNAALVLDTISVATALIALFIGIEHLRYVEEHQLIKRGVIFFSIVTITVFIMLVWHYGFRN